MGKRRKKAKDGAPARKAGRPKLPPELKAKPRSIRLNDAHWSKLQLLGREWLEQKIDAETSNNE